MIHLDVSTIGDVKIIEDFKIFFLIPEQWTSNKGEKRRCGAPGCVSVNLWEKAKVTT